MTHGWISDLVPHAPRSAYAYRAVGKRLKKLARLAVQPGEFDDLNEAGDRWLSTARRKAWSDERRVPE